MDVEKTMQFILEQLAETAAIQNRTARENEARDRRLTRLERNLTRLARLGVKARSRIHKRLDQHEEWFTKQQTILDRVDLNLAEMTDKLNGLIGYADRFPRNPQA
jgi:hypothetical protein